MIRRHSPNFNARDPHVPLRYVVLHYTGMASAAAALDRLCDPKAEVSAHYVIDEDGQLIHLVDESARAWHAGKSFWRGITDMNSASLGIELVNPGHEFGYRPFPAEQIATLKTLLRALQQRHDFGPDFLLAHSDIAPRRKTDPGELFPWRELAAEGLGLWPEPSNLPQEKDVATLLRNIGYDCPDDAVESALLAFQRRFEPGNLTGKAGEETLARLNTLSRAIPSV